MAEGDQGQREHVLRVTAGTLATHGFDGVRLRDVASAAGVSIGLIQHYFGSRSQLLAAAFEWSVDDLIARWRGVVAGQQDPLDRLVLLVETLADDPELQRRSATWTEFCAAAARHPELRGGVQRVFRMWREILSDLVQEGTRQGVFRPRLPLGHTVDLLSALVDGCDMATASRAGVMDRDGYRGLHLAAMRLALGIDDDGTAAAGG
ncbi:TetR family transcriptional regulator C-terminal domain-containing protein [Saccharopolyspora erythraea]|uniref:TetR/AcrR family transcriptional regulator n=1 Tax=Saccharopolyspora erythraea TaxID=1836 RepID=UPI001BAB004B|nr:TetR/AcrR family transcriptional regulator [Saccharopolyspora erythraea]QUH02478.1 TetR family transcriptional regulator C-terminal domain-containing protein [Saccharopolyspora erythraea]